MRSPHISLSVFSLLLPLLATALPQDQGILPATEPTSVATSTSTSTLTVTRTLVRSTSVVIVTLPDDSAAPETAAPQSTAPLPDIKAPVVSPVATDILVAAPYSSSASAVNSTLAPIVTGTGTGTGAVKPSPTGLAPATFEGAAAPQAVRMGGMGIALGMVMMVMGGL